jgi:hypothetical protein
MRGWAIPENKLGLFGSIRIGSFATAAGYVLYRRYHTC